MGTGAARDRFEGGVRQAGGAMFRVRVSCVLQTLKISSVRVRFDGGMLALQLPEPEEPRTIAGVYELYYGTAKIWFAGLLVADGRPIAEVPIFGHEHMVKRSLRELLFDRSLILHQERGINATFRDFIAQQTVAPMAEQYRGRALVILDELYTRFALLRVPEEKTRGSGGADARPWLLGNLRAQAAARADRGDRRCAGVGR